MVDVARDGVGRFQGPVKGSRAVTELESWDILVDILKQSSDEAVAKRLLGEVPGDGRYIPRKPKGSGMSQKEKKLMNIDALEGHTSYERPNGDLYYSRPWGAHADVEVLRKAREATASGSGSSLFALLYGSPGCGKTALVEAAFPDVYTLMGTGDTEVADLVGGYIQNDDGGFEWVDGDLLKAAENGAVYFIDEIGLIDPKVLSVVYGLMDGRRELSVTANPQRGTIKAHPNFYVVAATTPMLLACGFQRRCCHASRCRQR